MLEDQSSGHIHMTLVTWIVACQCACSYGVLAQHGSLALQGEGMPPSGRTFWNATLCSKGQTWTGVISGLAWRHCTAPSAGCQPAPERCWGVGGGPTPWLGGPPGSGGPCPLSCCMHSRTRSFKQSSCSSAGHQTNLSDVSYYVQAAEHCLLQQKLVVYCMHKG